MCILLIGNKHLRPVLWCLWFRVARCVYTSYVFFMPWTQPMSRCEGKTANEEQGHIRYILCQPERRVPLPPCSGEWSPMGHGLTNQCSADNCTSKTRALRGRCLSLPTAALCARIFSGTEKILFPYAYWGSWGVPRKLLVFVLTATLLHLQDPARCNKVPCGNVRYSHSESTALVYITYHSP